MTGTRRAGSDGSPAVSSVRVELRSSVPAGVLVAGREPVRLSWRLSGDLAARQLGYEVESADDAGFRHGVATSGEIEGDGRLAVAVPGPALVSRGVRWVRARVRTQAGWTPWSDPLRLEAGLLDDADWLAAPITLPDDPGATRQAPSPMLRRSFDLDELPASARLYVTALGLHAMQLNGRPVSEDLLAPGWTPYGHRLVADAYDVGSLLRPGRNVITATMADGWYRGRLGYKPEGDRATYGDQIGLIAQLELTDATGSRRTIATDGTWRAATGEIRAADLYDGSSIDLRAGVAGWASPDVPDDTWPPARVLPTTLPTIEPRTAPPVRVIDELAPVATEGQGGSHILDAGQNVAGWVRLRVRGRPGTVVRVRHAEVLEPDGGLHVLALRSAKATDCYVLADDRPTVLEPAFTFHGFRFAEIDTDAELLEAVVVAISSDTPRRSTFQSSHEGLNRLHENVVWSQRDNFVSIPTDCPQRDERLGWTGDAQAFAATGSTLFDAESFWRSWLRDLAAEQDDVLGVPSVVPNVVLEGPLRFGRAGWADAAAIVPWAVYESYGNVDVLAEQWGSMRRWVDSLVARLGSDDLLGPSLQFGDWLDPDAPWDEPWRAKVDAEYLANAFFAFSARLTADAAHVLGDPAAEERYAGIAATMRARTWARWHEHALTTQSGCAAAIVLGVAPADELAAVGDALASLVRGADGRVSTGFLGTPLVLPALSDTGHVDEAYLMLLCREAPSWLYQVDMGATTVWERWDAILPDGSIHPGTMRPLEGDEGGQEGHMLSFNHYAYGAVVDWMYRHVAGLAPDLESPGYATVVVAPKPHVTIRWVSATVAAALGDVSVAWRLSDGDELTIEVDVPPGGRGVIVPPVGDGSSVRLDGRVAGPRIEVGGGHHVVTVERPRVAGSG